MKIVFMCDGTKWLYWVRPQNLRFPLECDSPEHYCPAFFPADTASKVVMEEHIRPVIHLQVRWGVLRAPDYLLFLQETLQGLDNLSATAWHSNRENFHQEKESQSVESTRKTLTWKPESAFCTPVPFLTQRACTARHKPRYIRHITISFHSGN